MTPHRGDRILADLFWSKVDKSDDCWVWMGARNRNGYGTLRRHDYAHRVAWELAHGPIPDGLWVLHHCDNPPCVRPDHLFLGTQADNMADMAAKGRAGMWRAFGDDHWSHRKPELRTRGERVGGAKLTATDVAAIRRELLAGGTYVGLAATYGVTRGAIRKIALGHTWTHVEVAA